MNEWVLGVMALIIDLMKTPKAISESPKAIKMRTIKIIYQTQLVLVLFLMINLTIVKHKRIANATTLVIN
jgi:hypothetical protein